MYNIPNGSGISFIKKYERSNEKLILLNLTKNRNIFSHIYNLTQFSVNVKL